MRAVIQRVKESEVWIDSSRSSHIDRGLLILFGCKQGDQVESTVWLADKVLSLRIFEDAEQRMNLSLLDVAGEIMVVSQFTLYADARKGRRPAFTEAMEPVEAERLYNAFVARIRSSGLTTRTGVFGAKMEVRLINDGPVTILLDHDL